MREVCRCHGAVQPAQVQLRDLPHYQKGMAENILIAVILLYAIGGIKTRQNMPQNPGLAHFLQIILVFCPQLPC